MISYFENWIDNSKNEHEMWYELMMKMVWNHDMWIRLYYVIETRIILLVVQAELNIIYMS